MPAKKIYFKSFLVILFSLATTHLQGQVSEPKDEAIEKERLATMQTMVDQTIGTGRFVIISSKYIERDFTDTLKGKCTFLGMENIDFKALFTDQGAMTNFSASAAAAEDIGLPEFDAVKGRISDLEELGNFFIPPFLRDRIRFDGYSMDFNANTMALDISGKPAPQSKNARYEKMTITFKLLENWQPLKQLDVKLGKITVGFDVKYPTNQKDTAKQHTSNKRVITGNIAGTLKWKETSFKLGSNIVEKAKDWQISADVTNLGVNDIYTLFNIDEMIGMPLPSFLNQKINKATIKIKPMADQPTIELIGLTSIADVNFLIKRTTNTIKDTVYHDAEKKQTVTFNTKENKYGIVAGFSLAQDFSFTNLLPALSFMDKFPVKNFALIYSTQDTKPDKPETTSLPIILNLLSGDPSIYKGLTFAVWLDADRSIGISKTLNGILQELPAKSVMFKANVPENPSNLLLEGLVNFRDNTNIANVFFFRNFRLQMKPVSGSPEFSLLADIDLKVDANNMLRFRGGLGFQPGSPTIIMKGALVNDWNGPFGFKPLSVGGLSVESGINFTSYAPFPVPDNLLFSGRMKLGAMEGEATVGLDVNEPNRNMIDAKLYKISINNLIDAFCSKQIMTKIPLFLKPYFEDSKLDTAEIKLVQPPNAVTTVGGKIFYPGYRVVGDGQVMGWGGRLEFSMEGFTQSHLGGFTAKGKMDPIRLSAGDLKLLHITGARDEGKPEMIIDLSANHLLAGMSGGAQSFSTSQAAKIVYLNCGVSVLGVTNANALIDLTPQGFLTHVDGKLYGFLEAGIDAQIKSLINPLQNTYLKVEGKAGSILNDVQSFLTKKVAGRGFSFDIMKKEFALNRIYFEGKLDDVKTGAKAKVEFTLAGRKNSIDVNVSAVGALKLAEDIAEEVVKSSMPVFAEIQKAFDDAARAMKETADKAAREMKEAADKAFNFSRNATQDAINVASQTKTKLTQNAQATFKGTKDGFIQVGNKTEQFFKDFGNYSVRTAEKIFNKSIDKFDNGWGKFTDAMKKAFTGGDNEERIMVSGPAFRIITKHQNHVLSSSATARKNFPVTVTPARNLAQETWQLIPNNEKAFGSFYLVSGYNALLVTKPWTTHLILIPHESDHKNRERMLMESVPNEPGWYYLKYFDADTKDRVKYYTYMEVKNVMLKDEKPGFPKNVAQLVLAPVEYREGTRPGEYGKFKFEKAADIDWDRNKNLPPYLLPAPVLTEGGRYQFNGEAEQYIYTNGAFRWIPDGETVTAAKLDARPLIVLPNNQQVSTVLGMPIPSRKDGALVQAQNEHELFIMENGMRRLIPDAETINMLAVNAGMIQIVPKSDLLSIPIGEPIPSKFAPTTSLVEKAIYRQISGDGSVYVVLNNTLRGIPDPETLAAMGYNFGMVQDVPVPQLNKLNKGANLPSRKDGLLLRAGNEAEVFIMQSGMRRSIPDAETFVAMKLDMANVKSVDTQDLLMIPQGPGIVSVK